MPEWGLRYTSHVGYRPPFRAQFAATVGSDDPIAHIEFAAALGFAGVLYPWAMDKSEAEIDAVAQALQAHDLAASVIVGVPARTLGSGLWTDPSGSVEADLERYTVEACRRANQLGSGVVAGIVADPHPEPDVARSLEVAARRLNRMASIAADHGVRLGLEAMTTIPTSVLRDTKTVVDLVEASGHDAAGIVFDTGHSASMGENVREAFEAAYPRMVVMQFADWPDRVEPLAGTLELVPIGAALIERGWSGLVDLEHGWAVETLEGERDGLGRLRAFDSAIRGASD